MKKRLALKLDSQLWTCERRKDNTTQFGLLPEDVAEVNRDLVIDDTDGKPFAVGYDSVNAMLLNEFLKEHRKVARLRKQAEAPIAGSQRVSVQLQLNNAAFQAVVNNQ